MMDETLALKRRLVPVAQALMIVTQSLRFDESVFSIPF
jgi:hypothetical protein